MRVIVNSRLSLPRRILGYFWHPLLILVWTSGSLQAALTIDQTLEVFGDSFTEITEVTGRPWIEKQHVYESPTQVVTCSFVGVRCLWVEYFLKGTEFTVEEMLAEVSRLIPEESWKPQGNRPNARYWFNQSGDRITRRSTGFSLHTNAYIENVLSRREQWTF